MKKFHFNNLIYLKMLFYLQVNSEDFIRFIASYQCWLCRSRLKIGFDTLCSSIIFCEVEVNSQSLQCHVLKNNSHYKVNRSGSSSHLEKEIVLIIQDTGYNNAWAHAFLESNHLVKWSDRYSFKWKVKSQTTTLGLTPSRNPII